MPKKKTAPRPDLAQIAFAVAELAIGEAPVIPPEPLILATKPKKRPKGPGAGAKKRSAK